MKMACAVVGFILLATPILAQSPTTPPWTVEAIKSAALGSERPVFISTPENYRRGEARYPVLVLLDANDEDQFALGVAHVKFLAGRNAIPPLIVVGVPNGKDRTHDLTPVASGKTAERFPTAGGAERFRAFIVDEIMPHVRAKYRTLPTTILAGHSFGGLFALDVAASRPGTFVGIIAMSPALWWNDSSAVAGYADAIARSAVPQRLFATSGGLEPEIDRTTRRFASRLDSLKPAATTFAYRAYPDDTHGLTPAPSLADGLRYIFEPVSLAKLPVDRIHPGVDSGTVVKAVSETITQYARGARSLGLPERLPEQVLNQVGYNVLQSLRNPSLAAWAFRRNVDFYPDSPNVYDSLGDALLAGGDSSAAKVQFQRAVDVATRRGLPVANETREKLSRLDPPAASVKRKP
jgi:uncharacterized protein